MVTQRHRNKARIRAVALTAAGFLGLSGVALASSASAQSSGRSATSTIHSTSAAQHSKRASPIKHIVVLYLENHTFDSMLGFWCDNHPARCPVGGMPASVKLSNGATVTPTQDPDIVPNVDHSVASQVKAINGGLMNGWDKISGCMPATHYACVSGYKGKQIPNTVALANKFAISDNTFSLKNSPSWGGHLYAVMASLDGFTGDNPNPAKGVTPGPGWGCNSDKVTQWSSGTGPLQTIPSCIPDFALGPNGGAFEHTPASNAPTIMDRLAAAGDTWKIFGDPVPEVSGKQSPGYIWDTCPSIAECLDTSQNNNNVQASSFVGVAKAGNLPNFALVTPGGADAKNSEHNGTSITAGDNWIGQIASAIQSGPEWNSTALFITWDDCGCFYDQVKPGTNPDGTPQGPRSPLIIVSPFARPAFTDSTATTFAGILAFVESTFGLSSLGPNDAAAYDYSGAFNFSQKPLSPARMVYRKLPKDAYHINPAELRQDT